MQNIMLKKSLMLGLLMLSSFCYALPAEHNGLLFQVVQAQAMFDSAKIKSVSVIKTEDHRYSLNIQLTPSAAEEMKHLTHDGIGKTVNTVFNGKIISSAIIQGELAGNFQMDGFATKAEAEHAAKALSQE